MCHLRATASVRLVVMTSARRGLRPEAKLTGQNPPALGRAHQAQILNGGLGPVVGAIRDADLKFFMATACRDSYRRD